MGGMHALGWSRDRAIDFMTTYTPMADKDVEVEIDRYITWPGQATAYKIGQLKIKELRARSVEALGGQFDVRDFHKTVLNCYAPLNILEECVVNYIKKQTRRKINKNRVCPC